MRIVFMGTPDFGIPSLRMLVQEGYEVVGVITQPDRPQGRGHKLMPCPLKAAALDLGLPVYTFERIRSKEAIAFLQELAPEVMVTAAYGQILTQRILDIPSYGVVNVHGSLLPKYRGPAPIQWAIIDGEPVTGITTMLTARGVDSGDILLQQQTSIGEKETAGELFNRLAVLGAEVLQKTLEGIKQGTLIPIPQNQDEATYKPMLEKEMGRIDWQKSAREIECLVRGVNPWPGAFTTLHGQVMKVISASVLPGKYGPGITKYGLVVGTGDGLLRIDALQLPGKKAMASEDFLRGHVVPDGTRLGEEA